MLQQILAIIIIFFFLVRLFEQKRKNKITANEFTTWLIFWLIALTAIIFLKKIDTLVADLGFSGTGINVLVYLAVLALIYLVFRMRLNMAKMEKNISELNQALTLKK